MFDLPGTATIGEFGSELLSIFLQENAAVFEFRGARKTLAGEDQDVFGFRIAATNNHSWTLREDRRSTRPELAGELWVSRETHQVVRLDIFVEKIDRAYAADHARVSTTFDDVQFPDGGVFLLPRRSETKVCTRSAICLHNVTEWTTCKRFAGKARIIVPAE